MIVIHVKVGESIDSAIRRFNQAVTSDGLLKELKERAYYEKPSVKKRRKRKQRAQEMQNVVK